MSPARVLIIGGGVVGTHAARMAVGLGAEVTLIDRSIPRLRELDELFGGRIRTRVSTIAAIEAELLLADAVVGAVLIPGAAAPKLVTRAMLALMKPGPRADRRRDRPGRLLRDIASHHTCGPDVRGRRHHSLLRREYARCRPADFQSRPQQRDGCLMASLWRRGAMKPASAFPACGKGSMSMRGSSATMRWRRAMRE